MSIVKHEFADFGSIRSTPDGLYSITDMIQICIEYKNRTTKFNVWNRVQKQFPEVYSKVSKHQFPGRGEKIQDVATKENLLYILGLLPGAVGKKYREAAASLVAEFLTEPEKLAKRAIERIEDPEKLEQVRKHVEYKQSYHALNGELSKRDCEAIHHACVQKHNNDLVGIQKGERPFMNPKERSLLTALQSVEHYMLLSNPDKTQWGAVNLVKETGNSLVKQLPPIK